MVITGKAAETVEAKNNLEIRSELLLAVESFFILHPDYIEEYEWSKLALQLLSIIKTHRLQ